MYCCGRALRAVWLPEVPFWTLVTQIASLAIKSANAVILKGGREAANTNAALVGAIQVSRSLPLAGQGARVSKQRARNAASWWPASAPARD